MSLRTQTHSERSTAPVLPPELWIHIHRLATLDISPLIGAYDESRAIPADPHNEHDLQRYLQICFDAAAGCALSGSCLQAVEKPDAWTAVRKRSARHRACRAEHSPLYDALGSQRRDSQSVPASRGAGPADVFRRHFQTKPESRGAEQTPGRVSALGAPWAAEILDSMLHCAPNLKHICLASQPIRSDLGVPPALPSFPCLTSLALARLQAPYMCVLLRTDLHGLTRLVIAPAHLSWPYFPTLPALHTLALIDHAQPTSVPFSALTALFPHLRELHYDAGSEPVVSDAVQTLACPAFLGIERVVLDGRWDTMRARPSLALREKLRVRGTLLASSKSILNAISTDSAIRGLYTFCHCVLRPWYQLPVRYVDLPPPSLPSSTCSQ
ncbi:hypothetical protein FB451DRAFT_1187294 [Mycena latifolia]|nr:hypothetical protein FB451DRAFT_1187294 [Mycena latifolia]